MTPRASILTTCHNDGQYLGSAMASVLYQTERASHEHCVMLNVCTDASAIVADDLKTIDHPRIRLFFPDGVRSLDDEPVTQPKALNELAKKSDGEWLIVLNADDLLFPNAIATVLDIAGTNPDVNLIYSPWQWFGYQTGIYDFPPYTGDERMLTEHQIPGIRAVRRDLWDALGGEDESIAVGADWDWAVRGAARGLLRPYKHPTPLWLVRDHGPNVQRLSAQCDHKALRAHMARHFDTADAEC